MSDTLCKQTVTAENTIAYNSKIQIKDHIALLTTGRFSASHLCVLAEGEFLTFGLLECIDDSPRATEAEAVVCW